MFDFVSSSGPSWRPGKNHPHAISFAPDSSLLVVATSSKILLGDAKALLPVLEPWWIAEALLDEEVRRLGEFTKSLQKQINAIQTRK